MDFFLAFLWLNFTVDFWRLLFRIKVNSISVHQGMYIKSTYDGLHVITGTTEGVRRVLGLLKFLLSANRSTSVSNKSLSDSIQMTPHGCLLYGIGYLSGGCCEMSEKCQTGINTLRWIFNLLFVSSVIFSLRLTDVRRSTQEMKSFKLITRLW